MILRIVELAKLFSGKHNLTIFAGNKVYTFKKPYLLQGIGEEVYNLWAFYPDPMYRYDLQ